MLPISLENVKKKMSLMGAISPWEVGPILIAPQLHTDLVIDAGAAGGAPHGPHADLVIGFASYLA